MIWYTQIQAKYHHDPNITTQYYDPNVTEKEEDKK